MQELKHYLNVQLLPSKQASYSTGHQCYLGRIPYTNQPNTSLHFRTHFVIVSSSLNESTFLLLKKLGIRLTQVYPRTIRVPVIVYTYHAVESLLCHIL